MKYYFFPMNLQLFADGGAAAGDGGAEGAGVSAPAAGVQKGDKASLGKVIYGKPQESAPAAGVQQPESAPEAPDRYAEFEQLIKGDYKEPYNKRVNDTVRQRVKTAKETEERLKAITPILDRLGVRYGKDSSDIAGMIQAMDADDSYLEQAAMERNMSVQDYRHQRMLEQENNRLKKAEEQQKQEKAWSDVVADWVRQANEAKEMYPNLDLNKEMENEQFREKMFKGYSVADAYLSVHKDDVLAGAMQHTAKTVEQKLANNIAAGKNRPAENGTSAQSSTVYKTDPSKWSRAERDAVRRDVARGGKVYL